MQALVFGGDLEQRSEAHRAADRGDRLAQGLAGVVVRHPVQLAAGAGGVHQQRPAQRLDPGRLVGQEGHQGDRLGGGADRELRRRHGVPAELVGEVGDRQLARAGEVVDAGFAVAEHGGGERRGDVVLVDELEGDAGVGQDRAQLGHAAERPAQRAGDAAAERQQRDQVEQQGRVGPGDDAGAEDVGVGLGAGERRGQLLLDRGLVGGVGVALGALRRLVLVDQRRQRAVEAVGGDRGGVDEPLGAGRGGGLEDVARAVEVDLAGLPPPGDDREGEVDDDVGIRRPGPPPPRGRGCRRAGTRPSPSRGRWGRSSAAPCRPPARPRASAPAPRRTACRSPQSAR